MCIEVDKLISDKHIDVLFRPDVFKRFIANYKRELKRRWREQRHLYQSGTTKYDWMVAIGVNVDILNTKITNNNYIKNTYDKKYFNVYSQNNCPIFP